MEFNADELAQAGLWRRVLFVEDICAIFRIAPSTARKRLREGEFGKAFRSGRRWAIRRERLEAYLGTLEAVQAKQQSPTLSILPSPKKRKANHREDQAPGPR